ncbi:MAG TPA: DUF5681 domain-containing protein [Acetobacteraceae bacterium]|nr:DUF5681 domain-containing protein [Acetobacteraceae bacterium]
MPRRPRGDYEVGYGKPPRHSRFRPGRSGNPKGRPKGAASLGTLLEKALAEVVVVRKGDRQQRISKGEAMIIQLVNKAAGADLAAMKVLLDVERRKVQAEVGKPPPPEPASACPRCATKEPLVDYDSLTTEELTTLSEAARIMEGAQKPPPLPLPPTGPVRSKVTSKQEDEDEK